VGWFCWCYALVQQVGRGVCTLLGAHDYALRVSVTVYGMNRGRPVDVVLLFRGSSAGALIVFRRLIVMACDYWV